MGRFTLELNYTLTISLRLLLFSLFFICNYLPVVTANSSQLLSDNPTDGTEAACDGINCGQGTCKPSNATGFGFECECKPNWAKIPGWPSCILPNCTLNFQCGNESPPPPSPPLALPNISNIACLLIWCGDGNCITNPNGSTSCICNPGSSNLFNNPAFLCLKQCAFGVDCHGLGLGLTSPPPPSKSGSPPTGPAPASNCSRNLRALTMMLLAAIILQWS